MYLEIDKFSNFGSDQFWFTPYNVGHSIGDSYTSKDRSIAVPNGMANIVYGKEPQILSS